NIKNVQRSKKMKTFAKIGLIALLSTTSLTSCNDCDSYKYIGYKNGEITTYKREDNTTWFGSYNDQRWTELEKDVTSGKLDSAKIIGTYDTDKKEILYIYIAKETDSITNSIVNK
ncbi:MAG: hypothetical protein ACP5N1_05120, partial [Candidatus Woesearchaeota archaeon]